MEYKDGDVTLTYELEEDENGKVLWLEIDEVYIEGVEITQYVSDHWFSYWDGKITAMWEFSR